jgi:hypothetical protein
MAERKMRKLVLGKTTLRLLSAHQLSAVAGVDGVTATTNEGLGGQDSYRGCIQGPTGTLLQC